MAAVRAARAPRRARTAAGEIGSLGLSGGPLAIAGKRKTVDAKDWARGRVRDIELDRDYSGIVWPNRNIKEEPDRYPVPPQDVPSARDIRRMNMAEDEGMLAPMPLGPRPPARIPLRQRDVDAPGGGGPMRVGARRPPPVRDPPPVRLLLGYEGVVIEEIPNDEQPLMLQGGQQPLMLEARQAVPRVAAGVMHLQWHAPAGRVNPLAPMGDPWVRAAERINNERKRKREERRPRVLALPAPEPAVVYGPEPPPEPYKRSKRKAPSDVPPMAPAAVIQPLQRLKAAPYLNEAARRVILRQAAAARARVQQRYAPNGDGLTLAARRRHEKMARVLQESVGSVDRDRRESSTGSS